MTKTKESSQQLTPMTRKTLPAAVLFWLAAALITGSAGCGGVGPRDPYVVPLSPAENNLKHIAMAYSDAYSVLGHAPKDAEELKPFLKTFGNPDQLLVSPADNKAFVVAWGKAPAGGPTDYKGLFPVLAYEHTGVGGKRAVTDYRGLPMTVPNEDFPKLKFIGGHKPSIE